MKKLIGYFFGTPVYEDPAAPPGQVYLLNEQYLQWHRIDARSRLRRIMDGIFYLRLRLWYKLTRKARHQT